MAIGVLRFLAVTGLLGLTGSGLWRADIWHDRQVTVSILKPVALFPDRSIAAYGSEDQAIATIQPGVEVKVLRIIYGKDYMAFRVRSALDQEGWILYGENIQVSYPEDRERDTARSQK